MGSSELHEAAEDLSPSTREMHRAVVSLMEELEAIDWYLQRVDASQDEELKRILKHNRDEEVEHACMTLEWMRRHDPVFDEQLRRFLFRSDALADDAAGADEATQAPKTNGQQTLGLGSLREGEERRT